jgi:hypothetical protein
VRLFERGCKGRMRLYRKDNRTLNCHGYIISEGNSLNNGTFGTSGFSRQINQTTPPGDFCG